jgi:hypothetical protein
MIETVSGNGSLRTFATPFSMTILPSFAETAISAREAGAAITTDDIVISANTALPDRMAFLPDRLALLRVHDGSIQRRSAVVESAGRSRALLQGMQETWPDRARYSTGRDTVLAL